LRKAGRLIPLEPQVFEVLAHLVRHRDRVVTKQELLDQVWGGRFVSEAALSSRLKSVRKAIGDSGREQRCIRTVHGRGFRFVAPVSERVLDEVPAAPASVVHQPAAFLGKQEIRYCTASDGVRIAYARFGHGPVLLKAANWLNHLEFDWQSPVWRHWFRELGRDHTVIRYDARGNGLSDWQVEDLGFPALVADLEAVVAAAGLDRFSLLGISQGGAVAIEYAVRHPEKVERLILYGAYSRGWAKRTEDPAEGDRKRALYALVEPGWGQDNPAFRQAFTSMYIPGGSREQMDWFNELQRVTTSPRNARRIMDTLSQIDVRQRLPLVSVPTLVAHCDHDVVVPFFAGRELAAGIPRARFVSLSGHNHILLESEPAWQSFLQEVRAFLSAAPAAHAGVS
jgi:pimeloyl-ACP methyl ester carboxylesterase/DNA-binding winged helix-turn-helix (wHTH) protein